MPQRLPAPFSSQDPPRVPIDISELREQKRPGGGKWYFRTADGAQVCGSKRPNRGPSARCAQEKGLDVASGRCHHHGGAPGSGVYKSRARNAGPATLGRWRTKLEQVIADGNVEEMRDALAVLRTNMMIATEKVDELDTPGFRIRAKELVDEMHEAAAGGREAEFLERMRDLRTLIHRGAEESAAIATAARAATRFLQRSERVWAVKLSKRQAMAAEDVRDMLRRIFGEVSIALEPARIRDIKPELLGPRTLEHLESVLQAEVG